MNDAAPTPLPPSPDASRGVRFDPHMLECLICPVSHGPLSYDAQRQELLSPGAGLAFPIREGIPIMLLSEARQSDKTP